MTFRANLVTSTDIALLRALGHERSLVGASRRVGISRDRAVYRIERLEHAFGGPVVHSVRGGTGHGRTTLTALGDRIVRGGFESVELLNARPVTPLASPNLLRGVYQRAPDPEVRVSRSLRLRVAFDAEDGEAVAVLLDPESVVVARRRFPSSARNVLRATVETLRRERGSFGVTLVARCSGARLRVAVTEEPVRQLGLRPGVPVWLYVKATALRRVGERASRGSPRS
ncbi:MAG: TOBE domain-containing protein [Thermoplasmata archaeon]|jgi:molybdate transport repressor ModE-like protein/molybdopterin-binding protein